MSDGCTDALREIAWREIESTGEQITERERAKKGGMQMSELVYLACPYSHPEESVRLARFDAANKAAADLMKAGVLVFSPISHTHPIAAYGLPLGWDFWERYDREYLNVCKALVVLEFGAWFASKGVQAEISIMTGLHRPVLWMKPEEMVGDIAERLRGI